MGLFRIQHTKPNFEEIFDTDGFDTMHPNEWKLTDVQYKMMTYTPVEPKPPAPRSVSSRVATSDTTACTTGVITS